MMRIYEISGFPNPARIRIALAEKGLTKNVSFITVDVPVGKHRNAILLAKHPYATTPVLVLEDGTCIGECTAITEYLDHLDGTPTLTGRTGRERTLVHIMQRRVEVGLLDALTIYFDHAILDLGSKIETYQTPKWNRHGRARALASMRYLDGVLGDHPYLAGDHFSMADISAFAALAFADFVRIERPASLQHLAIWRARVAARPSIAAARSNL
jgi:glutathione S-transferase